MRNINRRKFMGSLAGGALSLSMPQLSLGAHSSDKPPNFILIMADDLGVNELGCYGNEKHRTPTLDALAETGVRFKTCYSTPLCSPTRVMLMTGRYGFRTKWYDFPPPSDTPEFDISSSQVTFADVLKTRGYATALAGKWQLPGRLPTLVRDCGFEEYCIWAYSEYLPEGVEHQGAFERAGRTARYWHPCILKNGQYVPTKPTDYGPDIFTDFLIDFIKRHENGPFLAYYPMCLTHTPWEPAPDPDSPTGKTERGLRPNVEYMDKLVGRIVEALGNMGLRDNTILLFTSDNGTEKSGKGQLTELGSRVPMIVNCPGIVEGAGDELIDLSDVLPTLADFAGADLPQDRTIDGRSFAPILRGEKGEPRKWIFSFLRDKRMLRDKRWLLEGDGRFFDCGNSRDGSGYKDVTESKDPEVLAARRRFETILEDLPAPEGPLPGRPQRRQDRRKTTKGGRLE